MKNLFLFFLSIVSIILFGCQGAQFYKISDLEETKLVKKDIIKILENSDPRFLDKVLSTIKLPDELFNYIKPDDKLIVQSVERNYMSDEDAQLVIYRGLVKKLLEKNLRVLDRDENVLAVSLAEKDSSFGRVWMVYSSNFKDSMTYFNNANVFKATKILGYRILEFGQTIVPSDYFYIQRVGVVELEIRLVDANTTQLYYIGQVRNLYYENIPYEDYQLIANLHYKFISDALPLVSKNVQYRSIINSPQEEKTEESKDSIQITFKRGARASNIKIYHKESGKVIDNFVLKSKSQSDDPYYVYTLKLFDRNKNRLPSGEYVILIDDEESYAFRLR